MNYTLLRAKNKIKNWLHRNDGRMRFDPSMLRLAHYKKWVVEIKCFENDGSYFWTQLFCDYKHDDKALCEEFINRALAGKYRFVDELWADVYHVIAYRTFIN